MDTFKQWVFNIACGVTYRDQWPICSYSWKPQMCSSAMTVPTRNKICKSIKKLTEECTMRRFQFPPLSKEYFTDFLPKTPANFSQAKYHIACLMPSSSPDQPYAQPQ